MDLDGEKGIRRNDARDASLSVGQVRGNADSPRTTDPHPFDSVEQPGKHVLAVDPQRREQRGPLILDSGTILQAAWLAPSNRFTAAEPHPQAEVVEDLLLHGRTESRGIFD